MGAKMVSSFVSKETAKNTGRPTDVLLSPSVARLELLDLIAQRDGTSKTVLVESIWRMTGTNRRRNIDAEASFQANSAVSHSPLLRLRAVPEIFKEVSREQNVVFEEEKQNLYLDLVDEAESWSRVIMAMEEQVWTPGIESELMEWTVQGVSCMAEALKNLGDGPLGLFSKDKVCVLFVQVLSGAATLLHRSKDETSTSTGQIHSTLAHALEELHRVGRGSDLHAMLLEKLVRLIG